jgi:hypothetical protein
MYLSMRFSLWEKQSLCMTVGTTQNIGRVNNQLQVATKQPKIETKFIIRLT